MELLAKNDVVEESLSWQKHFENWPPCAGFSLYLTDKKYSYEDLPTNTFLGDGIIGQGSP